MSVTRFWNFKTKLSSFFGQRCIEIEGNIRSPLYIKLFEAESTQSYMSLELNKYYKQIVDEILSRLNSRRIEDLVRLYVCDKYSIILIQFSNQHN